VATRPRRGLGFARRRLGDGRLDASRLVAVDLAAALNLVGALVKWFAPAFLFPAAIAVGYGEPPWPFLLAGLAAAAFGLGLESLTAGKERVGSREGFLVVSLVWLLVALFGSLPYLFSGEEQLASPVDALFESMSGFTTTGSSVLTDIPALDHSLLMWRQLTQWVGGLGIIVLALAVLPRLRVGGRQALFHAEASGPELATFPATIRETARRFVGLYVGLTAAQVAVLSGLAWSGLDARMTYFDAVAHAFTTIPTGGFSPRGRSLEEFGAASQWAVVPFMILGGTSFALLYLGLVKRRPVSFARDDEFRTYLFLLAAASLVVLIELGSEGITAGEAAVRQAVFNTVSIFTTTGFASADFNRWTALTTFVLVGGMLVSASAGSTAGGIKLVRHVVIAKMLRRELDQTIHPELVAPIRLSGSPIDERALRAIVVFAFLYVGLVAAGAVVILLDSARADTPVTPFQALAATATTLASVGPGFGFAGPMGSFDPFSDVSKGVLTALMWLGRLEIIPIIVLFTRSYWRA
jgi:trk system potassium uptake protein TrkH